MSAILSNILLMNGITLIKKQSGEHSCFLFFAFRDEVLCRGISAGAPTHHSRHFIFVRNFDIAFYNIIFFPQIIRFCKYLVNKSHIFFCNSQSIFAIAVIGKPCECNILQTGPAVGITPLIGSRNIILFGCGYAVSFFKSVQIFYECACLLLSCRFCKKRIY